MTSNSHTERFNYRLIKAKERIDRKLTDKELNNIYFLILYELPYIFCDGKVLAGFIGDKPTKEVSIEGLTDYSLRRQPLDTLHLTERVIKDDRFELIMHKFKYHDVSLRQLNEGHYEITELNAEGINLLDYLGITKEEQNKYALYKDNILYLFVNDLPNACKLIILFNHRNTLGDETLKEMHEKYFSPFVSSFKYYFDENDKEQLPVPCFMQIKGVKKELKDTLTTASIDEELYTRDYLDKSIDNLNMGIIRCINKKKNVIGDVTAYNEEEGMRSNFLRTMRPDVNYFLILLTASMCKAIFKTVKQNFRYMTDGFFKIYRKYYSELKDKNIKIGRWHDYIYNRELIDFFIREREFELEGLQGEEIVNELKKMTRDIRNFLEGKGELPLFQEDKKNYLKLTLIAKAFIETTPLVAGVAYTVGKKGCPYFCAGWQDEHPFLKTLHKGHRERPLRYPDFIEDFIDKMVLKSDKYHIMIDIPVISNGIFLGTFIIYPQVEDTIESTNKYFENMDEYLPELMDLVDNHRPDLIRSFFLDICANTTRILAGIGKETARQENQIASKDRVIENAEELLRKAHEIPRTYIIDVSGSDFQNKIRRRLASVFLESSAEVKKLIDWLIKLKKLENTGFAFFKAVHGATIELPPLRPRPVTKGRPVLENIYSDKSFASYKLLIIEDWKFIVLQINNKPENNFSQRELNDNNYICQAIETGLTTLKKKHEIIKHGTRAAVAAIMGRNMSHNIGSHVLSYWIGRLPNIEEVFTVDDDTKNELINRSRFLFTYLRTRMDFIAEISTTNPSWSSSMMFCEDVLYPFFLQKALLNYIAMSEGIHFEDCEKLDCKEQDKAGHFGIVINVYKVSRSGAVQIFGWRFNSGNSAVKSCHSKIEYYNANNWTEYTYGSTILKTKDDICVAIPHGVIGVHAVYSILENFIRNSAKHGAKEISSSNFEINITMDDSYDDLIRCQISDNVGNCNKVNIKKIKDGLSEDLVSFNGTINPGNWGIKEKRISACFLRMGSPTDIDRKDSFPPRWSGEAAKKTFLTPACNGCKKKVCSSTVPNINYEFYLLKPKECLVVFPDSSKMTKGKEKVKGLDNIGISEILVKDFEDIINKGIPHRFLVFVDVPDETKNEYKIYEEFLPLREISINTKRYSEIISDKNPVYCFYKTYFSEKYKGLFTMTYGQPKPRTKLKFTDEHVIYNEKNSWQYVVNEILYDSHSENFCNILCQRNKPLFYQGVSGAEPTKRLLENFELLDNDKLKIKTFELAESALTKVLIADERIWSKNTSSEKRQRMEFTKIQLVEVKDKTVKIESINEKFEQFKPDFFIIHQGLLDKMVQSDRKRFDEITADKKAHVVITSGRGLPNKLKDNARFLEISALEKFLDEKDKLALVQVLYSLRRPKNA